MRLTPLALLEAIREHLAGSREVFTIFQEQTGREAYVLYPCHVEGVELYVKLEIPPAAREADEKLIIISAHVSKFQKKTGETR